MLIARYVCFISPTIYICRSMKWVTIASLCYSNMITSRTCSELVMSPETLKNYEQHFVIWQSDFVFNQARAIATGQQHFVMLFWPQDCHPYSIIYIAHQGSINFCFPYCRWWENKKYKKKKLQKTSCCPTCKAGTSNTTFCFPESTANFLQYMNIIKITYIIKLCRLKEHLPCYKV